MVTPVDRQRASSQSSPFPTLLRTEQLTMEFPGVKALNRVDFDLCGGEVHALMGENGAGKSTLIKLLSGVYRPASGRMVLNDNQIAPRSPLDANRLGISTVHQEIDLIPTMSVAENICLGRQPMKKRMGGHLIDHRAMREQAKSALAQLDLEEIDVSRMLAGYSIAIQQLVAIARALTTFESKVLILDEPTSSLDADETRALFAVMNRLRDTKGMGIIFITHFLDQVYEIADRITVLRNGEKVGTWGRNALSRTLLVEAMTGRSISLTARKSTDSDQEKDQPQTSQTALAFDGLGRARAIAPTTAQVRHGESLGFAGLLGSGRTELARLLFGADKADSGIVKVDNAPLQARTVRQAVAGGVAYLPEDRKALGLILDLTVRENIILAMQARRGSLKPIARTEQQRLARHYIDALKIRTPSGETPVKNLSGGNQQKVLLARWLAMQPKILILDEPTRGIDVGARAEIESLVDNLKKQGLAIIYISSELDEICRMCERVLVLRDRQTIATLEGNDVNEGAILNLIAATGSASS